MAASFDPIYDPTYGELMSVIRRVRARWRVKVALRGLVMVAVAGFVAFAMSVWGMDYFLYSERAVQIFRWLTYVALIGLAVRLLVAPLVQRVSKQQVALYVEEHEPTLRASVLSAVELGPVQHGSPRDTERVSPELQRRVLEEAIERCQNSGFASRIERGSLRRFSAALAGVAGAGMAAVLLSPAFLQHGAMLLFAPWRAAAADNPYQLRVGPGNVTVARGSDQLISAAVLGFDPERVDVELRPLDASGNAQGDWQQWPMNRVNAEIDLDADLMIGDVRASHDFIALNLRADTDYYVDASGVRSPIYRIRVKDLPYVEQIDLEYRFPAYSGLSDRTVEDGGDIAVLEGTEVLFGILPIFEVPEGRLLIEGEEPIDLSAGSERLSAAYTISGNTYYRIELMDDEGRWRRASAEYMITALEDQPPIVCFTSPGRDIQVTLVDEVFAQVEAEDDYGVSRLGIRYTVNGGEETALNLVDSRSAMKKVSAGHTLFLEEMDLQVGDSISYYAEAWDRGALEACGQRHLLPGDQALRSELQAGRAGRRRHGWRRRFRQHAVGAAEDDRLGHLPAGQGRGGVQPPGTVREPDHDRPDAGTAAGAGGLADHADGQPRPAVARGRGVLHDHRVPSTGGHGDGGRPEGTRGGATRRGDAGGEAGPGVAAAGGIGVPRTDDFVPAGRRWRRRQPAALGGSRGSVRAGSSTNCAISTRRCSAAPPSRHRPRSTN